MIRKDFGAFLFMLVAVSKAASQVYHSTCEWTRTIENIPNGDWGIITSPNGLESYPPESMQCTFKLLPKPDEQVQLMFSYFNLRESGTVPATLSCNLSDSVTIITRTSSRLSGDQETVVGEYCGRHKYHNFVNLMSVGRALTIQFTVRVKENMPGLFMFSTVYHFRKNYGVNTNGQQNQTAGCHFTFDGRKQPAFGKFESPNFGGSYPFSTGCLYTFRLFDNQTLQLRFHHFELDGQPGCWRPNDDILQIKEGEYNWTDFYVPAEEDPAKRQANSTLYCGLKSPELFTSTNNVVNLIFKFGQRSVKTGFKGTYIFFPY